MRAISSLALPLIRTVIPDAAKPLVRDDGTFFRNAVAGNGPLSC